MMYDEESKVTTEETTEENTDPTCAEETAENVIEDVKAEAFEDTKDRTPEIEEKTAEEKPAGEKTTEEKPAEEAVAEDKKEDKKEEKTGKKSYGTYDYSGSGYKTFDHTAEEKKTAADGGKKKGKFLPKAAACIILAVIFGVVSSAAFQVTDYVGSKMTNSDDKQGTQEIEEEQKQEPEEETTTAEQAASSAAAQAIPMTTVYDVSEVVKENMPCMVSITNMGKTEIQSFFGTYSQDSKSSGSGIIVGKNDTELLIATNNHVVEGSETLNVCFADDSIAPALIKGTDSDNDLAVIAVSLDDISSETMECIAIAKLGDSDSLELGEPVIAIGNALGYGQSVTTGCISALNREVDIDNYTSNLIQTDAAINPGNSGGALLNLDGEVIGINSAKLASSSVEGMGYAIPISSAEPIIDELMNRATRVKVADENKGALGIAGRDVTSEISQQMGIPVGAYVSSVVEGSAAEEAGIQKGDVITRFDGIAIDSMTELQEQMSYYSAGETVEVVFERTDNGEYKEHTVSVTLSESSILQKISASDENETQDEHSQRGPQDRGSEEEDNSRNGNGGNFGFDFGQFFGK